MTDRDAIYRDIDAHLDESVRALQAYVRHPSVSVDGVGMRECAELVAGHYRALGCQEVEVVETETFPGVWAYYDAAAPLTVANYNMYDVRSVGDVAAWSHPPFEATIQPRGEYPEVLYGRGAHVPKGPDMAWLAALRAIRAVTGTLPVNLAFLAEGDEILGSQSYAGLIGRYRDRLAAMDGCIYLRAAQTAAGDLPLVLGYKTFITLELRASGASWGRGPVESAAHSATCPIVESPTLRLVKALSTLFSPAGEIAVDGWSETFAPPVVPVGDRSVVDVLAKRLGASPGEVIPGLAGTGVKTFLSDLSGPDLLIRYIYGSGLNIQGLYAGYTGPGTPTYTIPSRATARLDARLVTSEPPAQLIAKLRDHLDRRGLGDIEVIVISAYPGSSTSLSSPLVESFVRAVERAGGRPVIWPRQGYGGPWSILAQDFGVPLIHGTGIGYGAGVGQPDEFIVIDGGGRVPGFREMVRFCADFILDYAANGDHVFSAPPT